MSVGVSKTKPVARLAGPSLSACFLTTISNGHSATTSTMVLSSQSYVFDPRPDFPLVTTAKRFILSEEGLTLVFAHGNGFHKEQWEPTIEDLTKLLGSHHVKIREVSQSDIWIAYVLTETILQIWALDGSNQGDAAILNERALMWAYEPICACSMFCFAFFSLADISCLSYVQFAGKTMRV